jgi:hypothetical protein
MVAFIDQHRDTYGVEPICAMLPIAPSTYFLRKVQQQDATKRSPRARRDADLRAAIQRVWDENDQAYGPRKVWKQLRREDTQVARCTVERLMRQLGLRGVSRGRAWKITTQADPATARPTDLVDRHFTATRPNQLWVADFTYVATWRGFVYVAFVVDVFARCIVGWRVSASLATDFVLDALEQAIYNRRGAGVEGPRASQRSRKPAWVQGVVATPRAFIDARRQLCSPALPHFRMLPECLIGIAPVIAGAKSARRRLRAVSMCFEGTASPGSLREGAKRPSAGWRGCSLETRPLRMRQD